MDGLHLDGSFEPIERLRQFALDNAGREPDYVLEWLIPGKVARYKREVPHRGLSSKYGTYLAQELRKHRKWAQAMIADMNAHRGGQMAKEQRIGVPLPWAV